MKEGLPVTEKEKSEPPIVEVNKEEPTVSVPVTPPSWPTNPPIGKIYLFEVYILNP